MLRLERYRALAAHHLRAAQELPDPGDRRLHLSMAISWASLATRERDSPLLSDARAVPSADAVERDVVD